MKGSNEFALWSGGGYAISGGVRHADNWNVGLRYGRVLTDEHGPLWLRGRFEYTVDVIPIFWVFQPGGTAYGAGFDPPGIEMEFFAAPPNPALRRYHRRGGLHESSDAAGNLARQFHSVGGPGHALPARQA